jgi:hypothetical protein
MKQRLYKIWSWRHLIYDERDDCDDDDDDDDRDDDDL